LREVQRISRARDAALARGHDKGAQQMGGRIELSHDVFDCLMNSGAIFIKKSSG
jgi:hypothetical protein